MANKLQDDFGLSIPTKLVEGHSEDVGEDFIKLATALLKDLIATPRHQSRLPLGIDSSVSEARSGQSGEPSGIGGSTTTDVSQVQRSLLEVVEQLTKLALDESVLHDYAFEQLLDRIRKLVMSFRSRPILRL